MNVCHECRHSRQSLQDGLTRCNHKDSPTKDFPMPRPFPWCTHFECRGGYYRLKYPVLFEPYEGQPGVYRVHLGDRVLILTLSDQDMHDIFEKVSPLVAEATARIIKEDFA